MTKIRAAFLAAGFATRLYPLTLNKAKPLLEIGGEAMITRLVRQVEQSQAIVDGVVVTNGKFHADFVQWREALDTRLELTLVDDGAMDNDSRLGAIRDLQLALEQAPECLDLDGYLVLACDNLLDLDVDALIARFTDSGMGQLIVREVPEPVPPGRYSEVTLDGERVASFREKPADPRSKLSAIAVYLLGADLPAQIDRHLAAGGNPDAPGHLLARIAAEATLEGTRLTGRWFDIGSADDLELANRAVQQE
ncbi:nucleotidyltransferase family protein [Engelhardtia mirabilis]|uniref:Glucose-1-phosphate thymidylyltransferase n=1 Tax=Engelhardtia mirabilis TaxID=2528011 RepID=A0A518BEE5_9BACT|nr:Glucose-1-phosphate thymidylyltransferase [Planctomycetes bacterium Pla133]QDU99690.1 Glucose-1-phosphate thymidylyltransferase [Planctomycetes bacterium Pla86]